MRATLRRMGLLGLVSLAACGRTWPGSPASRDGAVWPEPDTSPIIDMRVDLRVDQASCRLGCDEVCGHLWDCGSSYAGECWQLCSEATGYACVQNLLCRGQSSCSTIEQLCYLGPAVDLRLEYLASANGSTAIQHFAAVCNDGSAASPPVDLFVYRNRSTFPAQGEKGDLIGSVNPLQPGACDKLELLDQGLAPGTYQSWAWVDPYGMSKDGNIANNIVGPVTVKLSVGQLPDLAVETFGVISYGSSVNYSATVCNRGAVSSPATAIDFYYDSSSAPAKGLPGDRAVPVGALAAGKCQHVQAYPGLKPGKTYSSWARVDAKEAIAELREDNNLAGPVKVALGNLPDLRIDHFDSSIDPAGAVVYTAEVCNTGAMSSTPVTFEVYYDRLYAPKTGEPGDQKVTVPALVAGHCSKHQLTASLSPGTHYSWAYVDSQSTCQESNESNNLAGPLKVIVGSGNADLYVKGFQTQPITGGVRYSAQICNSGSAASSSCYFWLYSNLSHAPSTSDKPLGSVYLGAIAAGACFGTTWDAQLGDGVYQSWAWVDPTGMVAESNESNNLSGPLQVILGRKGECEYVCSALVGSCALLPQAQLAACVQSCTSLPQPKVDCAVKAIQNQKCIDVLTCLFS